MRYRIEKLITQNMGAFYDTKPTVTSCDLFKLADFIGFLLSIAQL